MRLKITGIVCLLVMLGVSAWFYAHAQGTQSPTGIPIPPNGRFQILAAELDYSAFGGQMKQKTVVRIDTQTGQVWRLQETTDKSGGRYFEWAAVVDDK